MRFELTPEQKARILTWQQEQDAMVQATQLHSNDPVIRAMAEDGAYYGAIGGVLTYSFSPNSIGVAVTVRHAMTGAELDVTKYESW